MLLCTIFLFLDANFVLFSFYLLIKLDYIFLTQTFSKWIFLLNSTVYAIINIRDSNIGSWISQNLLGQLG